ncbi:MAG: immune inhibitor A [Candidatus Krumholzibacteria bacterium]|nr:immune inhibitor A [Candidatus Krumholzibacteria bacterium]
MGMAAALAVAVRAADADALAELRAERRAAVRAAVQAKAGGAAPFGLLVIPVDFADARFDPGFRPAVDLWPRLVEPAAGSLMHFYDTASRGRTNLVFALAPVVSLPGTQADYSDLYWQGYSRSRLLARLALERAAYLGMDFAASDQDGDGEVDGVLLLHAGSSLEIDPESLLTSHQYFLADPVVQRGIIARSYALASVRGSLGTWAHETGHLLGLEERYDLSFVGNGETGPRGGLGLFSLMAAGWLGSGQGLDPSLPDAYSCLQLGWIDLGDAPGPATAVKLRVQGADGPEYFLASQCYPELTAPYDALIPGERILIMHVDENLAEGQASGTSWPDRHLRVQLVQADGNDSVARGLSQGAPTDLFPTDGIGQTFNDGSVPSSRTWSASPSGIDVVMEIADESVRFDDRSSVLRGDLRLTFAREGDVIRPHLQLRFLPGPNLPRSVVVTVTAASTQWGQFTSGASLTAQLFWIEPQDGWAQYRDQGLELWLPAAAVPADATTAFHYTVNGGAAGSGDLVWIWEPTHAPLAIDGDWPGAWHASSPTGDVGTLWHRWLDGPSDQGLMLACTGAQWTTAAAWPHVTYSNQAHAALRSPPIGVGVTWVELTHAVDLELLHPGVAIDGVTLAWRHSGGAHVAAEPVDGWLGRIDDRAFHRLSGSYTFAVAESLGAAGERPLWRREIVALPDAQRYGPGPWHLEFALASDSLWRARGWLVRDIAGRTGLPPASGFPVAASSGYLHWTWEAAAPVTQARVETSVDGGVTWRTRWDGAAAAGAAPGLPLAALGLLPGQRTAARVLAYAGGDTFVSRTVAIVTARSPRLGPLWPNPAQSSVQLAVDGAGDPETTLSLFDLRGRLVGRWRPGPDATVMAWTGTEFAERPLAAGVYLFQLRAHGQVLTKKVTWLR